jgi:sterol desaturase/sphingolipid hydroxylase (fatty acid hydroxylase superfamily)
MEKYFTIFYHAMVRTLHWTMDMITFSVPWYMNFFYGLILVSLVVWSLELLFPWRKEQKAFRKDFWLDAFYMFFNFFLFAIALGGLWAVFGAAGKAMGITAKSLAIVQLDSLPMWLQLLVFFIVLDFVQWFTHILLHRFDFLWQFHKVHHSVEEMGFAAHLRYHWMENILYKPLKTVGVMVLGGFEPSMAYVVHFAALTIGHLNHANIHITWGPLRYLLNNPVMHLWHHARYLPENRRYGVNFGISLSLWDYLFRTNYIPKDDPNIPLGFDKLESFPTTFWGQFVYGLKSKHDKKTV